jgi:hypothetical protein
MSEVKVNKISPRSGTDVTLGDSGDTFTIPAGATINNQGTATNFGATGSASWTTTVKTVDFTAVAGEGYFVDTSSGAVTVTLPSSPSAGAVVAFRDYADTFDTNALTINRNSQPIGGSDADKLLNTEGIAATLIYIDGTKGWLVTDDGVQSTLSGETYSADFLVIAGGASGGATSSDSGGGGGAGGYRTSSGTSGGGASAESSLTLTAGETYTITVGAGGTAASTTNVGVDGSDSLISGSGITTITSIGGGGGGINAPGEARVGGSGGGAGGYSGTTHFGAAGTANQGYAGGNNNNSPFYGGGGGGGAGAVGSNGTTSSNGAGGAGVANSLTGSSVTRAGGGGAGGWSGLSSGGAGGAGGGGAGGSHPSSGGAGTVNTGSGGGGGSNAASSGAGGSGVVILSMPDANYSGTTTGSPTVATGVSGKTVLTFNASGSYTA